MSFLNGKIMKIAEFTIPINNKKDIKIEDPISGNSLQEIENIAEQLRNDYAVKNAQVKDPNKPVRLVIKDFTGRGYLENLGHGFELLEAKIKDVFKDKNDEEGTPEAEKEQ